MRRTKFFMVASARDVVIPTGLRALLVSRVRRCCSTAPQRGPVTKRGMRPTKSKPNQASDQRPDHARHTAWIAVLGVIGAAVIAAVATITAALINKEDKPAPGPTAGLKPSHSQCSLRAISAFARPINTAVRFPDVTFDVNTKANPPSVDFAGSYEGRISPDEQLVSVLRADPASTDSMSPSPHHGDGKYYYGGPLQVDRPTSCWSSPLLNPGYKGSAGLTLNIWLVVVPNGSPVLGIQLGAVMPDDQFKQLSPSVEFDVPTRP